MNIRELLQEDQAKTKKLWDPASGLTPASQKKLKSIIVKIGEDCSDFLKDIAATKIWPLHGSQVLEPGIYWGKSPQNRDLSDDAASEVQLVFDRALAELNFTATQSNSGFATGMLAHAKDYGDVFVMIPTNSSDFLWSGNPDFGDMYLDLLSVVPGAKLSEQARVDLEKEYAQLNRSDKKKIKAEFAELEKYTKRPTRDAEVMLFTENEWETQFLPFFSAEFQAKYPHPADLITVDTAKFQKTLKLHNTDFAAALKAQTEIYIHGSYYFIHHQIMNTLIDKNLWLFAMPKISSQQNNSKKSTLVTSDTHVSLPELETNKSLAGADLTNRDIYEAQLSNLDFSGAILTAARIINCTAKSAIFDKTKLEDTFIKLSDFKNSNMKGVNLKNATIVNSDFTEVNLQGAKLDLIDIDLSDFKNSNMKGVDLKNATIFHSDFTNVNLQGANLKNAVFNQCTLNNTDLTGADLTGAVFKKTKGNREIKLSPGVEVKFT